MTAAAQLRFFVAVHSVPMGLTGNTIRAATELRCKPPWLMGPAHAATHAYVAWTHGDGRHYRLDAQPGRKGAVLSTWPGPEVRSQPPFVAWELRAGAERAWRRAMELVGKPYDELEAMAQILPKVALFGFWDGGTICTGICTDVLEHAGVFGVDLVRRLPDLFPERLGQALQQEESAGTWLSRVNQG